MAGLPLLASVCLWQVRRRALPLLVVVAGLGMAFATATVLIAADYRDADGWVDCWPGCSALQTTVGLTFVWGGALLIVLGLVALGALLVLVARDRAAQRQR